MIIGKALEDDPNATADVYLMRPDYASSRSIDDAGFLNDGFMQGRTGDGSDRYPGDAFFKAPNVISVQLHRYDLDEKIDGRDVPVATFAPLIAVHVPRQMALPTLVQSPASPIP